MHIAVTFFVKTIKNMTDAENYYNLCKIDYSFPRSNALQVTLKLLLFHCITFNHNIVVRLELIRDNFVPINLKIKEYARYIKRT